MTVTEQLVAQRNAQCALGLDLDVRRVALSLGASEEKAGELVWRARRVFLIEDGLARAVEADRKTPWRRPDGYLVTVEDWVSASLRAKDTPSFEGALPARNPFKRETWNLTEQMRIQKQDPRMAERLRDACDA